MAKIRIYESLDEKGQFFNQVNIDNIEDFDAVLSRYKELQKKYKIVFRGMTEAKYKLYNSAQRHWIQWELGNLGYTYEEFINYEIQNAKNWQNRLIEKFFNAFGQPAYDLSVLSFLQHYGAPTPLLDWTYSFENALFFATDGLKYSDSDNSIDNYCSVYLIDTNSNELINYLEYIRNSLNQLDEILAKYPDIKSDKRITDIESFKYTGLHQTKLAQIPGYRRNGFAFRLRNRPSFNLIWNQQNLNIINQQGMFIFNYSEDKPLEAFFQGVGISVKYSPYQLPKIMCLNIHKSLLEYIKLKITRGKRFPITKEFIYPQEETIAKESFIHFLNQDFI